MNSAHTFAVETAASIAVVLSDEPMLSDPLINHFESRGVQVKTLAFDVELTSSAQQILASADYLCVIAMRQNTLKILGLPNFWQQLNNSIGRYVRKYLFIPATHAEPYSTLGKGFSVGIVGEWLGEKEGYAPTLDSFLAECRARKSLTIPGDGLGGYSLITKLDVVGGIIATVSSTTPITQAYLVDPQPPSFLNFAYQLRSALPYKININFEGQTVYPNLDRTKVKESQAQIGWHPTQSLSAVFQSYVDHYLSQNTPRVEAPPIVAPPVRPKLAPLQAHSIPSPVFVPIEGSATRRRLKPLKSYLPKPRPKISAKWRVPLTGFGIALGLYLGSLTLSCTITYLSLKNLGNQLNSGSAPSASALQITRSAAVYLQANLTALTELPLIRNNSSLNEANHLLSSYILGLDTLNSASTLAESSKNLMSYVLGDGESDVVTDINATRLAVAEFYDDISLLDGSLSVTPPSIIPKNQKELYTSIKSKVQEARRAALTGKSLLGIAPEILGVGGRRKYALLFQNNMELRSTGGFIGSFGIVSLENGKLFDIQVYDVYSADGQLKGHVEPPEEIKKYLGEANWYLRDSNWDPDFPVTARRVEWFLGKTMSQQVQGIIGINLYTLQDIIRAMGGLHLDEYDEQITAENLFERAEYHAEVNFFPGSTQKKEFIGALADTVIENLRHLSSDKVLDVTQALTKSIDEKNTLISLGDDAANRTLSVLGWNGELKEAPCPDKEGGCNSDYLMLVDNNFGVNKANYFLKRQLELDINILSDMSLSHQLRVEYQNTAKSSAWPAGPYKNYSRLYLPLGSVVSSVKVGTKELQPGDIKVESSTNHVVVGFLVEVPLDSTVVVAVKYATPSTLKTSNSTYSFYWQKQSGTAPDPLNINLSYPTSLEATIVSPKAEFEPGKLDFALSNITDRRITVKFK